MRPEQGSGQAAGLEKTDTEDDRISSNAEQRRMNILGNDHVIDQDRINRNAYDHKESLESEGRCRWEPERWRSFVCAADLNGSFWHIIIPAGWTAPPGRTWP